MVIDGFRAAAGDEIRIPRFSRQKMKLFIVFRYASETFSLKCVNHGICTFRTLWVAKVGEFYRAVMIDNVVFTKDSKAVLLKVYEIYLK